MKLRRGQVNVGDRRMGGCSLIGASFEVGRVFCEVGPHLEVGGRNCRGGTQSCLL